MGSDGKNFYIPPSTENLFIGVVKAGDEIRAGDFMYWSAGDSAFRPFSKYTGSGTAIADQSAIASLFAGVALQGRITAQTTTGYPGFPGLGILIASDAYYEADCASAAFDEGDYVGAVSAAGGAVGDLSNQALIEVASPLLSLGVVAEKYASSVTRVRTRLLGKMFRKADLVANPHSFNGAIGASTAAAGTTTADAGVLPAATAKIYPTTAADGTKGVRIHAADKFTGNMLFIGNGVSNQILKVYAPAGGAINGAAADAAFSSASGKGVLIVCLSGSGNTWLALG